MDHCLQTSSSTFISPCLPFTQKTPTRSSNICAQYLSPEFLRADFSLPSKNGSFGAVFFGKYEDALEPGGSVDVVVKCPVDSSLGRDLYNMEKYTNMKLLQKSKQRVRFPEYVGEVIIPESNNFASGLIRLGLVWKQIGNGDTLEDYLNPARIIQLASLLGTTSMATPLRRQLAAKVALELARILHDLQQCGIVHRDMKPENILVIGQDQNGAPFKAIDFGSSCDWSSPFKKGLRLATCDPIYTAPEKRLDFFKPAYRFDVFSIGLIALRCALPSLTQEDVMNNFVQTALQECNFSFSRVCSAIGSGRIQLSQAVKNDFQALTGPAYEDMYAFFATVLTEDPNDRADVVDCIHSRFVRGAEFASIS